MGRDRGRLFRSSNMTVSVNHIRFVLLWTHIELHQNTIHLQCAPTTLIVKVCIDSALHTHCITDRLFFKWHQMLMWGLWNTDGHHKSNSGVYVPLKHDEAFPWKDLHILLLPVAQLHPLTPSNASALEHEHRQQRLLRGLSNENHSSQSSLPETKGQCNLRKLQKLQSNLL